MTVSEVQSTPMFVGRVLHDTVTDIDGIKTIAELAYSILYLLEAVFESAPKSFSNLCERFGYFINVTYVVSIFNRIYEMIEPDEDGKMLWEYPASYIASTFALIGSNISNVIWLLDELKFIALGAVWNAIICDISAITLAISSFYEAKYYHDEIVAGNVKIAKAERCSNAWNERSAKLTQAEIARIVNKWDRKVTENPKDEKALRVHAQWQIIQRCQDPAEVKLFCERKAHNWQKISDNQKIFNTKGWIIVAIDITDIALTIFAMMVPNPIHALAVILALLTFTENIVCVVSYLMTHVWKYAPIHEIPLPGTPDFVVTQHYKEMHVETLARRHIL